MVAPDDLLDRVASSLTQYPNSLVDVYGHTDTVGSADSNQRLSEQRAQAVANYLTSRGVDSSRIRWMGFGETRPKVSTGDNVNEPLNRRVEIKIIPFDQQDIQAVVNAMWRGGASAVTVQGQRIVSTTGIKCEANSVTLQGVPYPQPYVIEAVGDPTALAASVQTDPYLAFYRSQAIQEDIRIGWDMVEDEVDAPAYDGLLDLSYAEPLDPTV